MYVVIIGFLTSYLVLTSYRPKEPKFAPKFAPDFENSNEIQNKLAELERSHTKRARSEEALLEFGMWL